MIARVFDDNYEKYYCTLCNRPFQALREATTQVYAVPWQGLTDEEYQEILKQHDGAGLLAFYNLVEAKLKEKNT